MEVTKTLYSVLELLVVVFSFLEFSVSEDNSLNHDIKQLAYAMPGCYSNARQYYAYSMAKTAPNQKKRNLLMLRAEFFKFESSLFNDSLTIYFQDFTKSSKIPFSSGFYSFTPDFRTKTIRMTVYTFKKAVPGLRVSFSNYSIAEGSVVERQLTSAFHKRKLRSHPSCDMVWRKTDIRTFVGVTRSNCLANLGKDRVRISVSMTLSGSRITLTEGWYSVDARARLRELKIPYVLKRKSLNPTPKTAITSNSQSQTVSAPGRHKTTTTKSFETKENVNLSSYHRLPLLKAKNKKVRENLRTYHKLNSLKMKLYNRLNVQVKKVKSTKGGNGKIRKLRPKHLQRHKRRVLRKYRHVKSNLLAGRKVFYKVDLSKCKKAAQVPVDRLSFGGEIKNFQIVREKQNRKTMTKIYFSTSKTVMSLRGVETIRREMTLSHGGHVEVKVIKQLQDSTRPERQYTFQCKLHGSKKRHSGVKIFTHQSSLPKEAKRLSRITRSLEQGRDLWLVADVAKCQGRLGETTVIAGGSLSDYDIVNDGKTLELFLPVDQAMSQGSTRNGHRSGFVIKVFKNNDVILTWASASNENSQYERKLKLSPAYRCELSNRLSSKSNEVGTGSVNVFIR